MLRDPQKRAAYDRYGEAGSARRGRRRFHHVDLSEALGIFMRDFGGFGGLEDLFGAARQGSYGPRAGQDVKVTIPLTLAEVATGVDKKINIKLLDPCDKCEGTAPSRDPSPRSARRVRVRAKCAARSGRSSASS